MVNFFQISEGDLPKAWYAGNLYGLGILKLHCPKKNLNFRLQTEPAIVGAELTVYVWCLGQIYSTMNVNKNRMYTAPAAWQAWLLS